MEALNPDAAALDTAAGAPVPASPPAAAHGRPLALVEVLDRDGQLRASSIVHAWPLTIGRALDNDIVLSDPHVAAHLLRIEPAAAHGGDAADGLQAVVGETVNGVLLGARRLNQGERAPLVAGAAPIELTVGRTRLRLRLPGHALAPELPLAAAATATPHFSVTLALALALLAGVLFSTWLDTDPDSLGRTVGTTLLASILGASVWCGLWALLSKTFTRQSHFGWHLRVFLLASIAWMALGVLPHLLAFALSWPWISDFAFVASIGVGAAAAPPT